MVDLNVFKPKAGSEPGTKRKSAERQTQPFVQIPCRIAERARENLESAQDLSVLLYLINKVLGQEGSLESTLTSVSLAGIGVNRWSKLRVLERLEQAGFVSVSRVRGKNPRVTLLPW